MNTQTVHALGNVLVASLVPLTLVATALCRWAIRSSGHNAIAPTLLCGATLLLRWPIIAIVIGIVVWRGGYAALVPWRLAQFVLLAAAFVAIDWSAHAGLFGERFATDATPAHVQVLARVAGYVLPTLGVLLLLALPLNARGLPVWALWSMVAILPAVGVVAKPMCDAVVAEHVRARTAELNAFWAEQTRLVAEGKATIAALADDAPLERLLPFLADTKWPPEVRGAAIDRITARQPIAGELVALLQGPHRDLAVSYIAQMPDTELSTDAVSVLRDALAAQAQEWEVAGPSTDPAVADRFGRQLQDAANLPYRFDTTVDFRPVMLRWKALSARDWGNHHAVSGAQLTLDYWLQNNAPVETP